ncbi:MAG: hypothetical protein QOF42_2145 [Gammaproteobacteria bacterium]|jgi:hypothetical protein|nr:hypothetical protein [Gammaproteobacteria bacterium]
MGMPFAIIEIPSVFLSNRLGGSVLNAGLAFIRRYNFQGV